MRPYKNALVIIDMQNDFANPTGSLYVQGALYDVDRLVRLLNEDPGRFNTIFVSLDSHSPRQIFFPDWWVDDDLQHPQPFYIIKGEESRYNPVDAVDISWEYVRLLAYNGLNDLVLWPHHCILGTVGHNMPQRLARAVLDYSRRHGAVIQFVLKGQNPYTEYYSIFEPEVRLGNCDTNLDLVLQLDEHDRIYIAGQAKSHCVLSSIYSIKNIRPDMMPKIRIIEDTMSSIEGYEDVTEDAIDSFQNYGMIRTTTKEILDV